MQKTTRLNRLLAAIVAVFMVVCCLPLNAFAEPVDKAVVTVNYVADGEVKGSEQIEVGFEAATKTATISMSKLKEMLKNKPAAYDFDESQANETFTVSIDKFELSTGWSASKPIEVKVVSNVKPTLKTIYVKFVTNDGETLAAGYTLTAGQSNVIYDSVYDGMEPAGQVLDHWVYAGQSFAKGSQVSFDQLAAIIGDDFTDEGEAYISFNPVFVDAPVVTPTLQKISVKFVTNDGKELAAGYELTAGQSNVVYDSVYDGMEPAGQVLDHWVYAGQSFAKGSQVSFDQLAAIIGDDFTDEGVAYISFNPVFVDAPVVTPTLQKISIKFVTNDGKELAAGYELTAGQSNVIYDSVYDGMEPAGQVLDHWVYAGQDFAKGSQVTFDQLAAIIGDNITEDGNAYISFNPVFVDKPDEGLKKIDVVFVTADGKEAAGHYTLEPGQTNFVYDSIYEGICPDGQMLDHWYLNGDTNKVYALGSQVTFEALAAVIGTNYDAKGVAYISFSPAFVATKTVGLNFFDEANYEQVEERYIEIPEYANNVSTNKIQLPDGYEFTVTGDLAINDGWVYVGVKCVKTLRIFWAVDNKDASFANGNEDSWTQELTWKHVNDDITMPEINVPDGYVLNGWSVNGQEAEFWKPSLKTMNVGDKYVADDNGGIISITANIVTKEQAQSGSSNSNTTTTVSSNNKTNNTEVVKAAAPADNTAKVMPQTGLTAETPVVFGIMMVAALAGAGAYLFAIRKKLN